MQEKAKLTYWGGLIFSDDANNLLSDTINQWGEDNNVDTEVVMINQNETNQKVSAAVESGTMPDALDMGLDLQLLLTNTGQLMELDDLYTKIGDAHGGWYASIDSAAQLAGARTGIPFGPSGNLLFSRQDVLDDAGLALPTTWQEVRDASQQAQKPPLFGMGFALSNVGDGNLQMSVLQSYGGRIADDAGTTVTLDTAITQVVLAEAMIAASARNEPSASAETIMTKLSVRKHSANTGPASPDMIAGAHSFQRSSFLLICATTRPPIKVPAMPHSPLKVPA